MSRKPRLKLRFLAEATITKAKVSPIIVPILALTLADEFARCVGPTFGR